MRSPQHEVMILVDFLKDRYSEHSIATFDAMSQAVHADVQYKHRSWLTSALNVVERDYGMVFNSVLGIGYEPVRQGAIAGIFVDNAQRRIKAHIRKAKEKLNTVSTTNLTPEELHRHTAGYLKLEIQEAVSSPEANQIIDKKVAQGHVTGRAGMDYARKALLALIDVS